MGAESNMDHVAAIVSMVVGILTLISILAGGAIAILGQARARQQKDDQIEHIAGTVRDLSNIVAELGKTMGQMSIAVATGAVRGEIEIAAHEKRITQLESQMTALQQET